MSGQQDRSPTLLLLHGQPGGREDWAPVADAIGARARVIAPDRPGWNGRTPALDLAGNARAARMAMDVAGVGAATVVGHSFGGAVAIRLALDNPERVSQLVLAAPAATRSSLARLDHLLAAPIVGELASIASLGGVGLALAAAPVRGRVARELGMEDTYLRAVARRLLSPSAWQAFVAEQRTLVRELPRLELELSRIAVPTTIIAGARDNVVPIAALRDLARLIPHAKLLTVPDADHLLPLREPKRFAELALTAAAGM